MKLFYNENAIYYSIYDKDLFCFSHTTNLPMSEFYIDEIDPDNKSLCADLVRYGNQHVTNKDGQPKYYINNGELYSVDDWVEKPLDL